MVRRVALAAVHLAIAEQDLIARGVLAAAARAAVDARVFMEERRSHLPERREVTAVGPDPPRSHLVAAAVEVRRDDAPPAAERRARLRLRRRPRLGVRRQDGARILRCHIRRGPRRRRRRRRGRRGIGCCRRRPPPPLPGLAQRLAPALAPAPAPTACGRWRRTATRRSGTAPMISTFTFGRARGDAAAAAGAAGATPAALLAAERRRRARSPRRPSHPAAEAPP